MYFTGAETLGPIGFTTYAAQTRVYDNYRPIIFDGVLFNSGASYDPISSMFTCPVTGVYVISLAVFAETPTYHVRVNIRIEEGANLAAYADNEDFTASTASVTAVIECDAGQRVWVATESGSNSHNLFGTDHPNQLRTSFSGFLLHAY